jgi:hypothetical protein
MGPLHWVFGLPIAVVQHFCCHLGFSFNSLSHLPRIDYLDGVHIIYYPHLCNRIRTGQKEQHQEEVKDSDV